MYSIDSDDDDEEAKLLRPAPPSSDYSSTSSRLQKSSETIFDVRSLQSQIDEEEIENDTKYVVSAINESHESLNRFVSK